MAAVDSPLLGMDLETIRNLSGDDLAAKYHEISSDQLPGQDFFSNLSASDTETVHKLCLLLYVASKGAKLPRIFQLQATLALLAGRDSLINAGTGSGKTLCMVLPALLDPGFVSLVVSPLKRLQLLQVSVLSSFRTY
jgi:ATP-dependent helicase YprA (DUF1998 family)